MPIYLAPYIEAHRHAYYDALKAAQQREEFHAVVGFVADAITGTVDELMATHRGLMLLDQAWRTRRKFRTGSASERTLALLRSYPMLTVTKLTALLDVSYAQAAKAVEQLVGVGILTERTGYRRNRVFAAGEILRLISRPYGSEPIVPEG